MFIRRTLGRVVALWAVPLLTAVSAFATTNDFSIGIKFAWDQLLEDFTPGPGTQSLMDPAEFAGVPAATGIPEGRQLNWNNAVDSTTGAAWSGNYNNPNTTLALNADNKGTSVVTTASVTWQANGTWSTSGSRSAAETNGWRFMTNSPPDHKLLNGYLDVTGAATPTLITISNIPPELTGKAYHVILYANGGSRTAGRGGSARLLDADSGLPLTPYLQWTTLVDPQTHTRDLGASHTDTGTYLLFTNLAAQNLRFEGTVAVNPGTGTPRVPVAAIQLISANLSEPIVGAASADGGHAYITITDLQTAVVDTNTISLKVDGGATAVPVKINKTGGLTQVIYDILADKGTFFASGSAHTNVITFNDTTGRTFTATRTYTVTAYTTVAANLAVSAVDTTKPGFRARVYQMPVPRGPAALALNNGINAVPEAERQLARGYIDYNSDPVAPYANLADLTLATDNGYFDLEGFINWDQAAGNSGTFNNNSNPPKPDTTIPGIPSGTGAFASDNIVAELLTYLQLQPGLYRLGCNGDDGFQFSIGRSPGDLRGQIIASRGGSGDTTFDIAITQAGFYPARFLWWEGNGGANLELYTQDLVTGARTLINDTAATGSIKAYRESATTYPYVSRILPAAGQAAIPPTVDVVVEVTDGTVPVDDGSLSVTINGTAATATKNGNVTTATRTGSLASLLPGGNNTVTLIYGFTVNGTQTKVTNTWTFAVGGTTGTAFGPAVVVIPPGNKVPASTVARDNGGFKILRVNQIDRSGDANQGNGGRLAGQGGDGNQMPRPEIQINNGYLMATNGLPYPNLSSTAGANPDGSFEGYGFLNLNVLTTINTGAFNASPFGDTRAPGVPGTGSSQTGQDNLVYEIASYLELKAGAYIVSVNSDDGFLLTSSPDVHDTLGTLVGMWNVGGGSASPPSRFICFVILEDGIYPFRLLWWQGGGGGNLEWMSVDYPSGRCILINDESQPPGIKAYGTYTGPSKAWAKFAVYPMPSIFQNQHQQSGPGPITVRVAGGAPVDIANDAPTIRPFADGFGAIFANLNGTTPGALLDGAPVAVTTTAVGSDTAVNYKPATPLASGSTHTAGFIYEGTTNSWTFTVQTYTNVPAGTAIASSKAQDRGFLAKVVQAAAARSLGNTAVAAETQLAGNPVSVAIPGPLSDGRYVLPGIVNLNVSKNTGNTPSDTGNFTAVLTGQPDDPVPGIPGTNTTGTARFENVAVEIFAYLDLPAGYQKFGVNGDDGWLVKIGTPGVTNGVVLFTADRGAGNRDIPFSFYVPEAGLYPVRLVWYQGGGGGNVEFFTYGANNRKIPVNANDPEAIRAYQHAGSSAPNLSLTSNSDGSIKITFDGNLQSATSLTTPINWQPVTATGTYTVNPATAGGTVFYRAVNP